MLSAKPQSPKLPSRHSRVSSFVEVTADGLTSESKKTGKRTGHLELQWNEDLTLYGDSDYIRCIVVTYFIRIKLLNQKLK